MTRSVLPASLLYLAIVFSAAFVLGVVRILVVEPRLGALVATAIEVPIVLAISWWACRYTVARLSLGSDSRVRIAMGLIAFVLLMSLETMIGHFAFGRSLSDQARAYGSFAAQLGLAGQIAFAAVPWLQSAAER